MDGPRALCFMVFISLFFSMQFFLGLYHCLLDGHSSHYMLKLIQTAAEHDIIFCLPSHMTADRYPVSRYECLWAFKNKYWSQACRQYMFNNPGCVITKFQFPNLFSHAGSKGISVESITGGFRSNGIYPFNPNTILDKAIGSGGVSDSSDEGSVSNGDSPQKENENPSVPSHGDKHAE